MLSYVSTLSLPLRLVVASSIVQHRPCRCMLDKPCNPSYIFSSTLLRHPPPAELDGWGSRRSYLPNHPSQDLSLHPARAPGHSTRYGHRQSSRLALRPFTLTPTTTDPHQTRRAPQPHHGASTGHDRRLPIQPTSALPRSVASTPSGHDVGSARGPVQ